LICTALTNANKVNFKKFRKIPKNLTGSQQPPETKSNKKTLFKSFKNEKIDVDTQFSQFMESIKSKK